MKSNSTIKPASSEYIGNGKWHYNYNIVESEKDGMTFYDYDQIELRQEPTYAAVVSAIIREIYSECDEMAIVNKYNSYTLGLVTDKSCVEGYKEFLTFVLNIKSTVKKDL
ncbi:MAG: hypothetical protein WCQ81_06335 [Bacteroidales bacterium]